MKSTTPILIYDNLCISCTRYAKLIDNLFNHKIKIVGLYGDSIKEIVNEVYPIWRNPNYFKMSWFIINNIAYGGRAGLLQMIKQMVIGRNGEMCNNKFDIKKCETDCMSMKGVWFRSMSILTKQEKVCLPFGRSVSEK